MTIDDLNDEARRTRAEARKLEAEAMKLEAERHKMQAERDKAELESQALRRWQSAGLPIGFAAVAVVAAALGGVGGALVSKSPGPIIIQVPAVAPQGK